MSELKREVDAKRHVRQQAKVLSDAQRLQIKAEAVVYFGECLEYQGELGKYSVGAFYNLL